MAYQRTSTANPLGHKPWSFATGNSGLSGMRGLLARYDQANFVIPTNTMLAPNAAPAWIPPAVGMGRYTQASFAEPTVSVGNPLNDPLWTPAPSGMGDYEVDPATLPPPPAGQQYNSNYQLVPIPQPNYTPWILLGLAVAGGAAYYLYTNRKKSGLKLPVVSLPSAIGAKA